MAEFCLDCWNKLNHIHLTEEDVILSKDLDLCEGCEEMKQVIIKYKERPWWWPISPRRPRGLPR